MSVAHLGRIEEARRRLREAVGVDQRHDHAVRIVQLDSPRPGEAAMKLHSGFAIVSGLTELAKQELTDTVLALHRPDSDQGLDGTVLIAGVRLDIHDRRSDLAPNPSAVSSLGSEADETPMLDPHHLRAVADALDMAVRLTSAELRGADITARELRTQQIDVPDIIDLRTPDAERAEIEETLRAMDSLEPAAEEMEQLAGLVESLSADLDLAGLESIIEQYSLALAETDPTDAGVRLGLESSLLLAQEELRNRSRLRTTTIDKVRGLLDRIGIATGFDDALDTAQRVLSERQELDAIRRRLEQKLGGGAPPAASHAAPVDNELAEIERRRDQLRRRLRTQRQLLVAAREHLAFVTNGSGWAQLPTTTLPACDIDGRPLPVLIEEPLIDLASELAEPVLSILLRLSKSTQVMMISDEAEVLRWAETHEANVGITTAAGWFAGLPERC